MRAREQVRRVLRRLWGGRRRNANACRDPSDLPGEAAETATATLETDPYPVTGTYAAVEWVRIALSEAREPALASVSRAVAEASYYLSDTMDPDERAGILACAELKLENAGHVDDTTLLGTLRDAGRELRRLLRGRSASSELRIALQALTRADSDLALHVQRKTRAASDGVAPAIAAPGPTAGPAQGVP